MIKWLLRKCLGQEMICRCCGFPNGEPAGKTCDRRWVHR